MPSHRIRQDTRVGLEAHRRRLEPSRLHGRRARNVVLLVVALLTSSGTRAAAAPASPGSTPPARAQEGATEARRRLAEAERHLAGHRYVEALAALRAAYALRPDPQIQYRIGLVEELLGHPAEAIAALELFLARAKGAPTAWTADARRRSRALHLRVGTVEVVCEEAGAELFVDGKSRGLTPITAPFLLLAGVHQISLRKEGFLPFDQTIELEAGQPVRLVARLEPASPSSPARTVPGVAGRGASPLPEASYRFAIAAGASVWAAGLSRRAEPSAAGEAAGDYCEPRFDLGATPCIGLRAGFTFLRRASGVEQLWSLLVAPSFGKELAGARLRVAAEIGAGILLARGLAAGSPLLAEGSDAARLHALELRPALGLEWRVGRSVALLLSSSLALSPRTSEHRARPWLVRWGVATGLVRRR
jgi:hypothetical protein